MNLCQNKQNLRISTVKKRKSLKNQQLIEMSEEIKNSIFSMNEFKNASKILFYVSYNNEVNTHEMIKECLSSKKTVIVPKTYVEKKELILSELSEWNHLEIGAYNILEPKNEYIKEVSIESIDLFIIPGVAFDLNGNRIGHGKGYYDKLLRKKQNAPFIALAFEIQIVENIPAEIHDIKMDKIVTEKRIINCKDIR